MKYTAWFNGNFNKIILVASLSIFLSVTAWGLVRIVDIPTTLSNYVLKSDYGIAHSTLNLKVDNAGEKTNAKFEVLNLEIERKLGAIDSKIDGLNTFLRNYFSQKEGSDVK